MGPQLDRPERSLGLAQDRQTRPQGRECAPPVAPVQAQQGLGVPGLGAQLGGSPASGPAGLLQFPDGNLRSAGVQSDPGRDQAGLEGQHGQTDGVELLAGSPRGAEGAGAAVSPFPSGPGHGELSLGLPSRALLAAEGPRRLLGGRQRHRRLAVEEGGMGDQKQRLGCLGRVPVGGAAPPPLPSPVVGIRG